MLFTLAIKQRWRDRLELKVVEWAHFQELHRRYIQNTLEAEQDERQTADRRTANESALEFGPNHSFGLSSKDSILLLVRYCVSWICPFTTDRLTYLPELLLPVPVLACPGVGLHQLPDHIHVVDCVQDQRFQLKLQNWSNQNTLM